MEFFKRRYTIVEEAKKRAGGHKLWLEILIFFAVFLTATFVESGILLVLMIVRFFLDPSLTALLFDGGGSVEEVTERLNEILSSDMILWNLFLTVVTTAVCILYCRVLEKRTLRSVGFSKNHVFSDYGKGLLTGLAMFSAVVLLGTLCGAFRFQGLSPNLSPFILILFFIGFILQALSEEVLCRGYFMLSAARKNSLVAAVIANSFIFAVLHAFNSGLSALAVVNLFLFGFFASVYMLKKGNIWGVAAIHTIWNFAQGNLYGLSVSGITGTPSIFVFEQTGKPLLDGGAFGPEGGLPVTVVLIVSIVLVFLTSRKKAETVEPLSETTEL